MSDLPDTIYLDNAATTPLAPEVLDAMLPYLTAYYGNPASRHKAGNAARIAVENAARQLADALHCEPEQLVFTSGGSMANNLAVQSAVSHLPQNAKLFTTAIEHSSLLAPMQQYADRLTTGQPDRYGYLTELPSPDTGFAAIQFANNELGTVQDMNRFCAHCRKHGILLHTDAVQAFGQLPIDLTQLPVDFLSLSAHKFSGPKGVGALFVRDRRLLSPLIFGNNRKTPIAGTENVAGIVGLGAAAELTAKHLSAQIAHKCKLRDMLKDGLLATVPDIHILSPENQTLPGILSICFPGIDSEGFLTLLDLKGICASAGSACHAGEKEPSHVLKAIGLPAEYQHSVIRFSIGAQNTEAEIQTAILMISQLAVKLRQLKL